ncbi:hypothetical protein G6045_13710 [Streptomyces sp. YC504]|uniref:Thioesterase family protein n=1 Tax=Streptomyces mesophilus TaxID=1775132 RepID=A0A6G4XGN0_9ACTN|nr:hotdog fold domain-containing protein [Streptomyces mesophilus]NGO76716.1 hypothetical protein [Streptomyces mesophilus]
MTSSETATETATWTETPLTLPAHVTGYPGVAFGGYVAGLLAARTGAKQVRVDFRAAVPVATGIVLADGPGGGAEIRDRTGAVLAAAAPAELTLEAPEPPSWAEAEEGAARQLRSLRRNPPPIADCYGCGPDVASGRGLKLLPGRVEGRPEVLAGAWVPEPELAGPDGTLPPEIVWAALDCPGGWTGIRIGRMPEGGVTARLTGTQLLPVRAGERHISYAWLLHREGRKTTVGVALTTAEGELCALGEALWITPKEPVTG